MTRHSAIGGRPSTDRFPESAKELGREMALIDTCYVWRYHPEDDGAGVTKPNFKQDFTPFRCRFDPYTRSRPKGVTGSRVDEWTDHICHLEVAANVVPADRLERADGSKWEILAVIARTEEMTITTQVKRVEP